MPTTRYNYSVFTDTFAEGGYDKTVPDKVIANILDISTKVSDSSYEITPKFASGSTGGHGKGGYSRNSSGRPPERNTQVRGYSGGGGGGGGGSRGHLSGGGRGHSTGNRRPQGGRPPVIAHITDADWEIIRNFEATKMAVREGVNKSIETITKSLNKLSDLTYDTILAEIVVEIEKIRAADAATPVAPAAAPKTPETPETPDSIERDIAIITNVLFEIASTNKFYSELYAKISNDLMTRFEFIRPVFVDKFRDTNEIISNIRWCSAEEDYDLFCKYNKENDKRCALCAFYGGLLKYDIIHVSKVMDTIISFQNTLREGMDEKPLKPKNEEITENLSILITNSMALLMKEERWLEVVKFHTDMSNTSTKINPGVSSKMVFRHLDIVEMW